MREWDSMKWLAILRLVGLIRVMILAWLGSQSSNSLLEPFPKPLEAADVFVALSGDSCDRILSALVFTNWGFLLAWF